MVKNNILLTKTIYKKITTITNKNNGYNKNNIDKYDND